MTELQSIVFKYIKRKVGEDLSPTYLEIATDCKLSAISQAYKIVDSLIKKGYLQKDGHGNRQITIKND